MERLDLLEKIYQFGETLSSEEMNQIVSYINRTIDSVNTLVQNNNSINEGHCEIRYKNSANQPVRPGSGSNGYTDGWSGTFSLPDTNIGEVTWMTLCFVTGEDVYGNWSTPVCISWGSTSGQQGPKGDSGETGAFTSRVFKRQNIQPETPVGGTLSWPIPDGWYDGVPQGEAIIWSSTSTFYGNGTHTDWSVPAQESDSDTLDIEFSPSDQQPPPPLGNTPYSNHEVEGWFDPNSPNFNSAGNMIWRAERKISNGEYDGDWTITRIYGEQGEQGTKGETGGNYEFRYINFKEAEDQKAPRKPEDGTDGISGGWVREQVALTELEIKEGTFTWMTQCYRDEYGMYGVWSNPIRITGANGIDGEDGTEQEFIFTRNNTGDFPPTPPHTQKNEESLFNELGEWTDPISGIVWTDDPQGVDDEMMWEFVSTRIKEGTIWGPFSEPVIWAKWGKQGKIGQMSYLAGVWNANTTYVKTAERNPIVYHRNPYNDTFDYYYLSGDITKKVPEISSRGQSPTGSYTSNNPNPWAKAENFEMVFTDILFVNDFAKLGSFIVNWDWMLSKNGTLYNSNGVGYDIDDNHSANIDSVIHDANEAYTHFDVSHPNENVNGKLNFVPAIAIDSLSGRAFFWKGYFKGAVVADSLVLGDGVTVSQQKVNNLITDLSNKLGYSVGNNFNINKNSGILTANNAFIDGTIIARSGSFVGDVRATKFIAGNQGGLNITTTGDAISFNYGGERRAWFTTQDENGNDTNGMFLYIKGPNGELITIDFTNLSFKNANISGTAIQQTNIYNDYTDSSYQPQIFINNSDNLYYSNSQLTSLLTKNDCYELFTTISCFVDYNGTYRNYPASIFKKVKFDSGVKTILSSNYYASSKIFDSIRPLYGSSGASGLSSTSTYFGDSDLTIANNSNINIGSGQSFYLAHVGTYGGGKITSVISQSWSGNQGADLVADSEYTIES